MAATSDRERLAFADRDAWRAWLEANHATSAGVVVLRARAGSGRVLVSYDDAVRQALCFGWVDGTAQPHDGETSGILFTPRRPQSGWAATNKQRVRELEASGEMTDAGRRVIEAARANSAWDVLDGPEAGIEPPEFAAALDAVPRGACAMGRLPALGEEARAHPDRHGEAGGDPHSTHRTDRRERGGRKEALMDDRTAILLVAFVITATTLVVFIVQWVRSRRDRD